MPQGDHHPPRRSTTRGFEVLALERIERRETRKACVYRHQASISFLFALAAQVQAVASLIWVSVHRHYPVPIEVFLGCNIVYVVLFFVYIPFWLSSRYHAQFSHRDPSPRRYEFVGHHQAAAHGADGGGGEPMTQPGTARGQQQQPQQPLYVGAVHNVEVLANPLAGESTFAVHHTQPSDLEHQSQYSGLKVPKSKHE
ncbi:hypothetical protein PG989_000929 [Apiospora arundinis]